MNLKNLRFVLEKVVIDLLLVERGITVLHSFKGSPTKYTIKSFHIQ